MKKPVRIYYLCIHNRCRSQIAEAFTRFYGGNSVIVESAGVEDAKDIHPLTIEVMEEIGIDISKNVAKTVDMKTFVASDVIVKLCQQVKEKCPIIPFGIRREHWDIEDPIMGANDQDVDIEAFRRVRDEIHEKVKMLLDEIGALEIQLMN
ncbi:arsenate reductase ArsC [Alicyclobacillus tolerans]|uniref:Arsenate reductase n=1 Tax=Alicyclobacillus tolerans TaxID=90970 RepID=A0A1M6TTG0_9BACL|nr:arsenate reductase ArsC [Alicyclobacillus montanus]SHK60221.1 arsenate reductase [Alicyclobacillus montanus]